MLDSCPPLPSAQLRLPTVAASAARYFVLAADNFAECLIQCPAVDKTLVAFGRSAGKSRSTPLSLLGCARSALFSLVRFPFPVSFQLPLPLFQDAVNQT